VRSSSQSLSGSANDRAAFFYQGTRPGGKRQRSVRLAA